MNRRTFLCRLTLGTLAVPLVAEAQPAGKVWRIGCLWAVPSREVAIPYIRALESGLKELGYVEGQNLTFEHRFVYPPDRLQQYADELVRLKVDALLAASNPIIAAAKRATMSIPIVMIYATSPVEAGLIKSLARPGVNVTGLTLDAAPEVFLKPLELLKAVSLPASRVAVVWDTEFFRAGGIHVSVRNVKETANRLGLSLRFFDVRRAEDIDDAFREISSANVAGVYVMALPVTFANLVRIAKLVEMSRLPAVYGFREHVEAGGLLSYGPNIREMPHQAARYFDQLFKGRRAADLPVEQPTKYELVINLKTAKALGLTIPPSLLLRADEVIQ